MAEPHALLDALPERDARAALTRCCGASRWVSAMLERRPYGSSARLLSSADEAFSTLSKDDWLEAFLHHPRIGEDMAQLRARFADTASWATGEQSGVQKASEQTLTDLRDGNVLYQARFGFPFIVCATGKSANELLAVLRERLPNEPAFELALASGEQTKITQLRLAKLA